MRFIADSVVLTFRIRFKHTKIKIMCDKLLVLNDLQINKAMNIGILLKRILKR